MSRRNRNQRQWGTIEVRNDDPMGKPFSYKLNDQERLVRKIKSKKRNFREIYAKLKKEIEEKFMMEIQQQEQQLQQQLDQQQEQQQKETNEKYQIENLITKQ